MKFSLFVYFLFLSISTFAFKNDQIATVQLYPKGNEIGMPIIQLRNQQPLVFEFDYLGEDAPYFNYRIEHYSSNWKTKSSISPLDFIEGFNTGTIDNFEFSFDTKQLYTHYEFEFPNNNLRFEVSGNYKILVFKDGELEPIVEERFYVTEQAVNFSGEIQNSTGIGQLDSHQEIEFSVDYRGFETVNPRQEFTVNVIQNRRPDNQLINLKPSRFNGDVMVFDNPFKQTFAAGNEFRWFNIKSTRYQTERVADIIKRKNDETHVYLVPDVKRRETVFLNYNDFNGQFVVEHQEGRDPDLDGEYVYVHFTLKETEELKGKPVYVYGELTDWELNNKYKLEYNPKQNLLETVVYLKQGNYDYMYVTKDGREISNKYTEGNYYRTENDYTVFVYYRQFSSRYDRLVGVQQFDSRF